ncbi:MAG: DNA repair protein RadA [Chloroherpetonaceae bacterium]|nr:DNA repair protein RadA [Chloroherpetonaceae bacterium]
MSKVKTRYVCSNCGAVSIKYQGKCFECGKFGTLVEEVVSEPAAPAKNSRSSGGVISTFYKPPKTLGEIGELKEERLSTGISEFDRVLGGGIMSGSIILIGGEPGIGKSTLMLQIVPHLAHKKILYVSAEESAHQVKNRATRMGITSENLMLFSETELELILEAAQRMKPDILIVDSIQTIFSNQFESAPGSVSQVRECTSRLMQNAKREGQTTFVVGHITKEGTIAGPKVLEHIVDTVLQFEGENHYRYRILRALKNRFGSTNEIGVFEMNEEGLSEVMNPSELFLAERSFGISGSAIAATVEGSRPVLVEIQSLVSKTNYAAPQRIASGFDQRRLYLLLAVLEKRLGLPMWSSDVFLNIAGGLRLDEPAVDLAVAIAVVSSLRDIPADSNTIAVGEIGLAGELRAVPNLERRISEAKKLGFERIVVPENNKESGKSMSEKYGIEVLFTPSLGKALDVFLK